MPNRPSDAHALEPRASVRSLLALVVALGFFVVSASVSTINLGILKDDSRQLVHSYDVVHALDALLVSLQDAETGQRGFLLSGNEQYLAPYTGALTEITSQADAVELLTRDNAMQQARIAPLKRHIDAKLAELKETIDLQRSKGRDAALAIVNTDRGKTEMDAIRTQIGAMQQEESRLRMLRLAEMDDAYRMAWATGLLSGVIGVALTLVIGFLLRRAARAQQRQQWLQSGQVGIATSMLGDQSAEQLGERALGFLSRFLGAQAGAIFAGDGSRFQRTAMLGVGGAATVVDTFGTSEGLLGQVAASREPIVIDDVPDGYLTIGSALGRDKPRHLVIAPLHADGVVNGVVELGFLSPVGDQVLALLEQTAVAIGVALRSARYRTELQILLEETQRQAEELQVQSEELRVSNEELEEQGRALKESQVRLEQQQVELEQINTQLEEQAQQLENQRDDLARSKAAVELKAREIEQASRYKSDFLANMSHELRTPLNSLLILSKLLGENADGNLTDEQVKFAQTIESSGTDLLTLINDILDLSKIEAGHLQIRSETLSVKRLAEDLERLFRPVATERRLQFEITVGEDCPDRIVSDRQRLEQVLKNLLSNAFKFTEAGGVRLTIGRTEPGGIAFAVADTGIGIPDEAQASIFEAFHQADGTISRRYGGTGLGLSISRELTRLLGGAITLRSRPGEGSTFTLTLPTQYDPALVGAREPRPAASVAIPATLPPRLPASRPRTVEDDRDSLTDAKRILLVVEDDQSFAGIVRTLAREMGFQSVIATTAEEALDLAKRYKPNAIVLDVGLPDQSGLAVLDRLKRDDETRHLPVHVVSAHDHAQTALSLGAVGYLVKPVKREQLAEVLRTLEDKLTRTMRRVLIVEDDPVQRDAMGHLLTSRDVETIGVGSAAECLAQLAAQTFDCMVLDLSLPDASGFALLETLSHEETRPFPPVIVYTGRDLTTDEEQLLRRYSHSIIIKGAKSPERLLDEVSLFLHQVMAELPPEQQTMIKKSRSRDAVLEGRRILIVEDDVRNVYALTNILEPRGAKVAIARNGQEAIDKLGASSLDPADTIDLVLMDVMMPVMDGLAATQAIRTDPRWAKLPIIALTAKAMPDDQERCLAAGANDYMAKPLAVDKLLSLLRVWMPR